MESDRHGDFHVESSDLFDKEAVLAAVTALYVVFEVAIPLIVLVYTNVRIWIVLKNREEMREEFTDVKQM